MKVYTLYIEQPPMGVAILKTLPELGKNNFDRLPLGGAKQ